MIGALVFAVLAIAFWLGQPVVEHVADRMLPPPSEADGKAALADIVRQVRGVRPAGRPTWLSGPAADNGCALPAAVLQPQGWAVLDVIEHDGEFAHLYAVSSVRQATLVRARFRWPDGEIEYTVTDLEAGHGK